MEKKSLDYKTISSSFSKLEFIQWTKVVYRMPISRPVGWIVPAMNLYLRESEICESRCSEPSRHE